MQVRGLPILFLCCVASPAQNVFVPIEGERVAEQPRLIFNRASTAPAMKCSFKPTASTLTFSLQYEAAYSMEFSVASANSGSHYLDSFLRLQLDRPDAKPLYLGSRYSLPPQLGPGDAATLTAHFPLSPGDWRVEALAVDENGGVCRQLAGTSEGDGEQSPRALNCGRAISLYSSFPIRSSRRSAPRRRPMWMYSRGRFPRSCTICLPNRLA